MIWGICGNKTGLTVKQFCKIYRIQYVTSEDLFVYNSLRYNTRYNF